jgi:hypothetical protein
VPFLLYYLRWGMVLRESSTFCLFWTWIDTVTTGGSLHLVTWCCLERDLFVFHGTMMKKRLCLVVFHHIPLLVTVLYAPVFYANVVLFQTFCTNTWDYTLPVCGFACYLYFRVFVAIDVLFHFAFPSVIIILSNAVLLARVVVQKMRHRQPVQWDRQRRLIIQLAFISVLFLICLSPLFIVGMIQAFWIPGFLLNIAYDYFFILTYFANLLLPFTIVSSLPKLRSELYNIMLRVKTGCRQPRRTHPMLVGETDGRRANTATVMGNTTQ